jgi:hypothetical protein
VVLIADDGQPGNSFGQSVSITNNTVVVGAPGTVISGGTKNQGAAYVFTREGKHWMAAVG